MPHPLLQRLRHRASTDRVEVCPPAMRVHTPLWLRAAGWIVGHARIGVPQEQGAGRLPQVRDDFADSLTDILTQEADQLRFSIRRARSMRELWHLRAAAYRLVALHHSEHEAARRVGQLARHFPTRAARGTLGAVAR